MTIYWLFFAFVAVMALAYGDRGDAVGVSLAHRFALLGFLMSYVALAGLRFEIGGDWVAYDEMFIAAQASSLTEAMGLSDPGFGLLLWLSAQVGGGIYLVDAICAWLLGYGIIRLALSTRDPWLAVVIALPYLLIVVGMGYVRQAAAMGLIMLAVDSLSQARRGRTIVYLALAASFHSTASVMFPLFGYAMTQRYRAFALVTAIVGTVAFAAVLLPRLNNFEVGYLDSAYDSRGATVRLAMNVLPALILVANYKRFVRDSLSRAVWIGTAAASVIALIALQLSPSSTAVDRVGLYFAMIQVLVFGSIIQLLAIGPRMRLPVRVGVVMLAAGTQLAFLVFGTHAESWVPYKSILQFL